jgi:hypothetical protein
VALVLAAEVDTPIVTARTRAILSSFGGGSGLGFSGLIRSKYSSQSASLSPSELDRGHSGKRDVDLALAEADHNVVEVPAGVENWSCATGELDVLFRTVEPDRQVQDQEGKNRVQITPPTPPATAMSVRP